MLVFAYMLNSSDLSVNNVFSQLLYQKWVLFIWGFQTTIKNRVWRKHFWNGTGKTLSNKNPAFHLLSHQRISTWIIMKRLKLWSCSKHQEAFPVSIKNLLTMPTPLIAQKEKKEALFPNNVHLLMLCSVRQLSLHLFWQRIQSRTQCHIFMQHTSARLFTFPSSARLSICIPILC